MDKSKYFGGIKVRALFRNFCGGNDVNLNSFWKTGTEVSAGESR